MFPRFIRRPFPITCPNMCAIMCATVCVFTACCGAVCADETPVSFELDVQPILTAPRLQTPARATASSAAKTGSSFRCLALDPGFDYAALVFNARGRRVSLAAPERSLLLRKATGEAPHGGGIRFREGGDDYETNPALGSARSAASPARRAVAGENRCDARGNSDEAETGHRP